MKELAPCHSLSAPACATAQLKPRSVLGPEAALVSFFREAEGTQSLETDENAIILFSNGLPMCFVCVWRYFTPSASVLWVIFL